MQLFEYPVQQPPPSTEQPRAQLLRSSSRSATTSPKKESAFRSGDLPCSGHRAINASRGNWNIRPSPINARKRGDWSPMTADPRVRAHIWRHLRSCLRLQRPSPSALNQHKLQRSHIAVCSRCAMNHRRPNGKCSSRSAAKSTSSHKIAHFVPSSCFKIHIVTRAHRVPSRLLKSLARRNDNYWFIAH